MPKRIEWHWDAVGVSRPYRKAWDELGITPAQFKALREASSQHFTTGKKSESNRIWKLIESGHSLASLISLAKVDVQEASCLLGCLLELTNTQNSITRETLNQIRRYLEHLPECFDSVVVVQWMQLLSLDELSLLKTAGFVHRGEQFELDTVNSSLEQIKERVNLHRTAQVKLLAELTERFEMYDIETAVQDGELWKLISLHTRESNLEREMSDFASGRYGDWESLGISRDEMIDIVDLFYDPSDSMKQEIESFHKDGANNSLFRDFKKLLHGGLSAQELLSLIRDGLTADDISGLKEAGLTISEENIANWSFVEGKVILFCIDNGISHDDRGDEFASWMPNADVVLPWWDYCMNKGWLNKYTKAELLQGISWHDADTDQFSETLDGSLYVEVLSLSDYVSWTNYSGLKGKFKEIDQWRARGFEVKERTTPPNFNGLDGASRSDAHAWRYFKFSPSQAYEWLQIRLMGRVMPGLSPKEASEWRDAGVKPDEVRMWFDNDIKSPAEVAAWIAMGTTPEIAQIRKRAGVIPPSVNS